MDKAPRYDALNIGNLAKKRANRALDGQERYILKRLAHKTDIAGLCYLFALTPKALQREADRLGIQLSERIAWNAEPPVKPDNFDDMLHMRLSTGVMVCPMCDDGIIIPWTKAALHGVCEPCYYKALAEAGREFLRKQLAVNEYDNMRYAVMAARKREPLEDGRKRREALDYDAMAYGKIA